MPSHPFYQTGSNEVGQIRLDKRERIEAEAAAERRLIENPGVAGVDESGQQLDRREFAATRESLRRLASAQMGHYRNREKRYQEDLLRRFERYFEQDGLSQPNGIALHVSTDGQSWYAERQTVPGTLVRAIGAAGPPTDQWLFDGCRCRRTARPETKSGFRILYSQVEVSLMDFGLAVEREGYWLEDDGHIVSTCFVDVRPAAARSPIRTVFKAYEAQFVPEVCGTILISKPARFRDDGETLISDRGRGTSLTCDTPP